jgi:hypothetical protein
MKDAWLSTEAIKLKQDLHLLSEKRSLQKPTALLTFQESTWEDVLGVVSRSQAGRTGKGISALTSHYHKVVDVGRTYSALLERFNPEHEELLIEAINIMVEARVGS